MSLQRIVAVVIDSGQRGFSGYSGYSGGGGGTPGGSDQELQYNDIGEFDGITNWKWNDANGVLTFKDDGTGQNSLDFTDSDGNLRGQIYQNNNPESNWGLRGGTGVTSVWETGTDDASIDLRAPAAGRILLSVIEGLLYNMPSDGIFGLVLKRKTDTTPTGAFLYFKNAAGSPVFVVDINGNLILASPTVPATASSTGTTGQISWDANFIYVCVATNTWKRAALSTW